MNREPNPTQPSVNKQTNKQTRVEVTTLWLRAGVETEDLLRRAAELASRDKVTITALTRAAFTEYVNRHYPGNPTIPLTHWTKGEPLSQAAQEKLIVSCKTRTCDLCQGTGKEPTDPYGLPCGACGGHGTVIIE
jgi:hypothetical protein